MVLAVCTANLCRSPMIELCLEQELRGHEVNWTMTSAGLQALDGQAMHPNAAAALARQRVDIPPGWRSRRLTVSMVKRAGLILAASSEHRSAIIDRVPEAARRTYLFRQFTRFVVDASRADPTAWSILELADRGRMLSEPPKPGDDDMADPIGASRRRFRAMCSDIHRSCASIAGIGARGRT